MRGTYLLVLAGAIALAGCGSSSDPQEPAIDEAAAGDSEVAETADAEGGEAAPVTAELLTIGSQVDLATFDPAASVQGGQFIHYLQASYDSLLQRDSEGNIRGHLATEWEYREDNTVLALTLREDATFADGSPVDAEAVKAALEHLGQGTGGAGSLAVSNITDIEVVGDHELVLTLGQADPGLLYLMTSYGGFIVNPAALDDPEALASEPSGSGPYLFDADATVPGSEYHFTKRDDHWDADSYPYERIVIRPIEDAAARLNALLAGQIDAMFGTSDMVGQAEAAGIDIDTVLDQRVGLYFNNLDGSIVPEMADVRLRQAINLAIDRESLVDNLYDGFAQPTTQIFNPGTAAWQDELTDAYPYDPDRARELVEELGYSVDDPIVLPIGTITPGLEDLTSATVSAFAEVGIEADIIPIPLDGSYVENLLAEQTYFLSFGTAGQAWIDIDKYLNPDAVWYPSGYESEEMTDLIAEIRTAEGPAAEQLLQELNTLAVEEALFAPFVLTQNIYLSSPEVEATVQQGGQPVPSLFYYTPADAN